jgi:hypothetical protein
MKTKVLGPSFSRVRMKNAILFGLLCLGTLNAYSKSPLVREGTQVLLSPTEIADLKVWVENAKHDLSLLEDDTRRGTLEERRSKIVRDFEAIVGKSGSKENELLMRFTLNRALEIDELVGRLPAPSELQSLVAFLDQTIVLSKSYYTDDQKYLEAIGRGEEPQLQTPMVLFAGQYAQMILAFSRTFLRPELEYKITYAALGWLANDLNSPRNLLRIQYAETITRIARLQANYPQIPVGNDQELLKSIRQFKWEYRERVLKHVSQRHEEIKESLAAAEAKRREDEQIESDRRAQVVRAENERRQEAERIEAARVAEENRKIAEARAAEEARIARIRETEAREKAFEAFKVDLQTEPGFYSIFLYFGHDGSDISGKIFRSEETGRTIFFSVSNGQLKIRIHHRNDFTSSKSTENVDGNVIATMQNSERLYIHPTSDGTCIKLKGAIDDRLCRDNLLAADHKIDRRGIYFSKTSSRFLMVQGSNSELKIQYNHGDIKSGVQKLNFQSPVALTYVENHNEYTFQWTSKNCVKFSWGTSETDDLCRDLNNDTVPYGIYRSAESNREIIFRGNAKSKLEAEYNKVPGRFAPIQENGVGYVTQWNAGYTIESSQCINLHWGYGNREKLCKAKD